MAIELKSGEFKPESAGKMQFYLSLLNDRVKLEDENPSIGIIVCKNKKRAVVEYALRDSHKPMGVATYKISAVLPREYKKFLPLKNWPTVYYFSTKNKRIVINLWR